MDKYSDCRLYHEQIDFLLEAIMNLVDFDHPIFDSLWCRLAVIVICIGWGGLEFYQGAPFWGILFGALGLYCIYGFSFIRHDQNEDE